MRWSAAAEFLARNWRALRLAAAVLLAGLAVLPVQAQQVQEPAAAATDAQAVERLLSRAEQLGASEGTDSMAYFDAVLAVLKVVQVDARWAAAHKRALHMLLKSNEIAMWPGEELGAELQLGSMEFAEGNHAAALEHLWSARKRILGLRARHANALQRWPVTQWLEETEVMIAECLHRLQRADDAAAAYAGAIERLQALQPPKPAVLARALRNAAALASEQRQPALALQRMQASVEQTLAVPAVTPDALAEALSGLLQAAAAGPAVDGARSAVGQALALAHQADLPRLRPAAYLAMLDAALGFYMETGDMQAAQQALQRAVLPDAAAGAAAPGVQLALALRMAELAAQAGDEAPFRTGWEAMRRAAFALPPEQRQAFAESARALAWTSVPPVIAGAGEQGRRAFRAREMTELAAALLLPLLPPEHPRARLVRLQEATWQLFTEDTPSARPALEALLEYDDGTAEDAALRALAMQWLGMAHAVEGRVDAAIVLGKEALNAMHGLPLAATAPADCGQTMCLNVQAIALGGQVWVHKWLTTMLIRAGRLSEAQQLLQMVRENELADSLRWGGAPPAGPPRMALTGLELDRFQSFYRLREQQAALASERQVLQAREATGRLDAAGRARLQQIGRLEAEELKPAMLRFLRGLDLAMAAGADAAVVQNSASVRTEATQIQRDVDLWAREAAQAKAVGVQYLVDRDTLSIVVTAPGLSPIARQQRIARSELYEAVSVAQTLLRTPQSDPKLLRPALGRLHALLLAPIEGDLRQLGAHTLLLSLDDRLRQLPFSALVGGDGRYLVEDYALALYNEGAARVVGPGRSRDWRVAAMGLSKPVGSLPALTAVPAELAQVVRASRSGGQTFLDGQFTRATLYGALARPAAAPFNVLHLASHFVLQPGNAGASTLFLGDGSSISLAEMAQRQLDFRGFELVVYSACESGVAGGRGADGMEMESLSALTRRQGAAAVMGTLWKVADGSVSEAMATFYGQSARADGSLAETLRRTQLAMLHGSTPQGSARQQHPFHWAPFVLMGNWQ